MTNMGDLKLSNNPSELDGVAVCKKDTTGKVLKQNKLCKNMCGDRVGQVCTDKCMPTYATKNKRKAQGVFHFENMKFEERDVDVVMLNDGETLTTLLIDLKEKRKSDKNFFSRFQLTDRELEIIELVIRHKSNAEIAETLFISQKTLKTHINHILKKIPNEYWPRAKA